MSSDQLSLVMFGVYRVGILYKPWVLLKFVYILWLTTYDRK